MTNEPETRWEPPEPLAVGEARMGDGAPILLRRHGNPGGRRLVLSHGNSMAIDAYYPFWSLLERDFDLVVYDLRNHGRNEVTSLRKHNLPTLIDDHGRVMEAVDGLFGRKPKTGVFHSMSALIAVLSHDKGAGLSGLILLDPPFCKPGWSYEEFEAAAVRLAAAARRRSARFRTREEYAELLRFAPTFARAVPGALDLIAAATLRESAEGGYELACPPEYEAQMLKFTGVFSVSADLGGLRCPVKVIGADPTVPYSYLPTLDLSDITSVDYDFLPDATHILQLEQPEACAQLLREFIDSVSAG